MVNSNIRTLIRTLIADGDQDRIDQEALFAVLDDTYATTILACLAPTESLLQIAADLMSGWAWDCDGWDRRTDELVGLITDPRCPFPEQMIGTWSDVPSAVGVLCDRTDDLVAWAERRLHPEWHAYLATLLGPSDAAARLLLQSPSGAIGQTLRRWSMSSTEWQAMIAPDLRVALHQSAEPSRAFPAWGDNAAVVSGIVLDKIVDDLFDGWSPDHPSLRGRIGWIERHVDADLNNVGYLASIASIAGHVGHLAILASIAGSDALAERVCACVDHDPSFILRLHGHVPWGRLHPRIRSTVDTTVRQTSVRWIRTWACALGQAPVVPDPDIDADLLLWRIDPELWDDLDPSTRAALAAGRSALPDHCFGWGVHPDLVAGGYCPDAQVFRFWNPHVPADDLRAWAYADSLLTQRILQELREMISLLHVLPPNRARRFEKIIDWHFDGCFRATAQSPEEASS